MSNATLDIDLSTPVNVQMPPGVYYFFVDQFAPEVGTKITNGETFFCQLDCGVGKAGISWLRSLLSSFQQEAGQKDLDVVCNCVHFDTDKGRRHALLVGPMCLGNLDQSEFDARLDRVINDLGIKDRMHIHGKEVGC